MMRQQQQYALQRQRLTLTLSAALLLISGCVQAKEPKINYEANIQRKNIDKQQRDLQQPETRIVGGDIVTSATKYPFYMEWEDAKCGASLIHDDIALSAAHCENVHHPFDKRVFLLGATSETGLSRYIEHQVAHPLYSGGTQDYDFLVLKLSESAVVDANGNPTGAVPVTLNTNPNIPVVDDALVAMGFGKTSENTEDTSPFLREVEVYYVSDTVCMEQYGISDFLAELMFCAGVSGGGKDTCQGDSGGPIMHTGTNTQVGVVSFGIGCARESHNGVYARVEAVSEWLKNQICEMSDYPPARCNAPAPAPDVLPAGGVGKLTVHVQYDDYPEETAWELSYLDMADGDPLQLFLHPFAQDDTIRDRATRTESFANLPGGTYNLRFGDSAGDGVCCAFGNGRIWVVDDNTGNTVWSNQAFSQYVAVQLQINTAGSIVATQEDFDYENSWEAFNAVNHPPSFDEEWPGALPNSARNAVTINVKFDAYPQEVEWTFSENANGNSWSRVESLDGATQGSLNSLTSVEVDNLSQGWHRFSIVDSEGDGVCCQYRRGWVSLTAPLVTTGVSGLVWGNNGEFGAGVDVYLLVDAGGFISQVSYTDPLLPSSGGRNGSGSIRRSGPGDGRQLEENRQRDISSYTDLPKQQLKQ